MVEGDGLGGVDGLLVLVGVVVLWMVVGAVMCLREEVVRVLGRHDEEGGREGWRGGN